MEKGEDLAKLTDAFAKPEGLGKTVPEETENVEPIRTMEQDMNRVHGYGAYRQAQEEEDQEQQSTPSQNGMSEQKQK